MVGTIIGIAVMLYATFVPVWWVWLLSIPALIWLWRAPGTRIYLISMAVMIVVAVGVNIAFQLPGRVG